MKTVEKMGAQGDVLFRRVKAVPKDAVAEKVRGRLIVAHSETGHHHAIDGFKGSFFRVPGNPLIAYLQLTEDCDVVHHRGWDTHETIRLKADVGAVFEVRRQREWTPEGWRRVAD